MDAEVDGGTSDEGENRLLDIRGYVTDGVVDRTRKWERSAVPITRFELTRKDMMEVLAGKQKI